MTITGPTTTTQETTVGPTKTGSITSSIPTSTSTGLLQGSGGERNVPEGWAGIGIAVLLVIL